jgi:hypothetical protein
MRVGAATGRRLADRGDENRATPAGLTAGRLRHGPAVRSGAGPRLTFTVAELAQALGRDPRVVNRWIDRQVLLSPGRPATG